MYCRARYSAHVCAYESMDINKDLVAATASPLVLAILAERDSYGYAILKRVSELSGGELQWSDGMLYPVLHRLERQGHIKGKWGASETGRKRKYYHLTARGRAQLAEQRQQWQTVDAALRTVWPAVSLSMRTASTLLPAHG
jgi:PadR family transcriptional regulator, regulatory protein PadR